MQITPDEFCALHPTLYHVTFASNVAAILSDGLKSAAVLKFEASLEHVLDAEARTGSQSLPTGATLNDQLPYVRPCLEKCCLPEGMSRPCEWFSYLDQHVFFWTTEENLAKFLKLRRRLSYESAVFQIKTQLLLRAFADSVALSAQNTGGPYPPNPAPRERFSPLDTFPFREYARRRKNQKKAIVELVTNVPMNKPELLKLMPEQTWPI